MRYAGNFLHLDVFETNHRSYYGFKLFPFPLWQSYTVSVGSDGAVVVVCGFRIENVTFTGELPVRAACRAGAVNSANSCWSALLECNRNRWILEIEKITKLRSLCLEIHCIF